MMDTIYCCIYASGCFPESVLTESPFGPGGPSGPGFPCEKNTFLSSCDKTDKSMISSEGFVIPEGHGHQETQPLHQDQALPEAICVYWLDIY